MKIRSRSIGYVT